MKKKRITIREVASAAGVSYQTVSRVLNNKDTVHRETRDRVLRVIEELGYRPDPVATSLATQRTFVLGLITATFTGNAIVRSIEAADRYAIQHGYQMIISGEEHKSGSEPLSMSFSNRQRIEGYLIIYHGAKHDNYKILKEIPEHIPIVTTGYGFDQDNILSLRADSRKGAYEAVRHLISLGHRDIAMLTGPEGAYETEERNIGYTQALDEAGIDVKGSLIYCGDFFVDSGSEMTKRLIESRQPFTAVFAHSDRMAIGCISALWEAGYRVPEDVAVIGYNDIPISRYVLPPLTTVRYPTFELGQLCTKLLIEKTNGVKNPEKNLTSEELESLEPRLIIRRSCGACLSTM